MLSNKAGDMTPFDMQKPPYRQNMLLLPLIWGASYAATRRFGLKIERENMDGVKPPYIIFSTHQGFSDYYIAPLAAFPHRANYVSDMEGFAAFGEWLYRSIGCIGKRRYVPELSVLRNIRRVLDNGDILVIFPESRHSNIGTTSLIPENMGRLAKMMNVPVVTLSVHGSYLANPFWDENHTRTVPMNAKLKCICRAEDMQNTSVEEIQRKIQTELSYDEYKWQWENKIKIDYSKRAEGIHKALYQCPICRGKFAMQSSESSLKCDKCGAKWQMDEFGRMLFDGQANEFSHVPHWYEWQRQNVIEEIDNGQYGLSFNVRIEALPNSKGFVDMGRGVLSHSQKGFVLSMKEGIMRFTSRTMESVQTEYDYRGCGMCIVLSTRDCCYYIYSDDKNFNPTYIQFAAEYFHQLYKNNTIK